MHWHRALVFTNYSWFLLFAWPFPLLRPSFQLMDYWEPANGTNSFSCVSFLLYLQFLVSHSNLASAYTILMKLLQVTKHLLIKSGDFQFGFISLVFVRARKFFSFQRLQPSCMCVSPALAGGFFPLCHLGRPFYHHPFTKFLACLTPSATLFWIFPEVPHLSLLSFLGAVVLQVWCPRGSIHI